jgi:CRP-like cAMP-binding protein
MVSTEDLRQIVILSVLPDAMLQKILPLVERKQFEEQQTIFSEGDTADKFYMLVRGKVLLQQVISDKVAVSMDVIKPGFSFGWSAMLSGGMEPVGRYTSNAVCLEPCECMLIDGDAFQALLDEDYSMGYLISQRIIRIIKKRLVYRNRQFARIIEKNPDLQNG